MLVLCLLLACGGKVEEEVTGTTAPRDERAGFVRCGTRSCDVGAGNQCFFCTKGEEKTCMTLDLPTSCPRPVRFWCDGDEDCKDGKRCVDDCAEEPCSAPGKACK
jgi:hypothetical protein